jgi:hypothetical protein
MTKTYFLIDDEANSEAPADGYAEELTAVSQGSLRVEVYRPTSLQKVLEFIAEVKPDGLLLDVAFTNAPTGEGAPLAYDGIALAQQIRTLQTRGLRQGASSLPEFPLIRFSKADVIREYVSGDTTSEDLFDEKIDKAEIIDDPVPVAKRAFGLAVDYPKIVAYARNEPSDEALAELLGCAPEFLSRLDPRTLLGLRRDGAPAHILSRYLTGALLERPGPLVDDALLAVRLGVDRQRSGDWPALRATLTRASYGGAFAQGYERWWMALVLDWWSDEINSDRALYRVGAAERVQEIARKTNLAALTALPDDPDSPGSKFWHLCLRSKRPVDPAFGFPLMPVWGQEPWQDVDYLCLEEAKRDSRNPRLNVAERMRLASLTKASV